MSFTIIVHTECFYFFKYFLVFAQVFLNYKAVHSADKHVVNRNKQNIDNRETQYNITVFKLNKCKSKFK